MDGKMKKTTNYSHRSIMWLIYMRTILELSITYDDSGKIKTHKLTMTALQVYTQICNIERHIFQRSIKDRDKYMKAHEMSKPVWKKSLDVMGEDYLIFLDPILATLYSANEREMKSIGLNPTLFMRMYDSYFAKYNCELEVQSVAPVDVIVKETERVLFEYKKENKRESTLFI